MSIKVFFLLILPPLVLFSIYFYRFVYKYELQSLTVEVDKMPSDIVGREPFSLAVDILGRMTSAEKRAQLYGEKRIGLLRLFLSLIVLKRFPHVFAAPNKRLGVPPLVLSDGPRGARLSDGHAGATAFPVAMARGASWDVDLEARVHEVIGKEVRALGANMAASPCINLLRHPGWGRAQETYGEDPWHVGTLGVAATKALQKHNVMAAPKHFALNSIENSRFVVSVEIEERALREVYLPHFKRVVQEGDAASLMTAYNRIRGEYAAQNRYLTRTILREEWGFEGFLHSDWVMGTYDAVPCIKAGMNIEMPNQRAYSDKAIDSALASGEIDEADIDELVEQSLRVRLQYALAQDHMKYDRSLLACNDHINLAREAAEQSMVLLKNSDVLPLVSKRGSKTAVIGKLANVPNTGDHGSSDCPSPYVVTPLQGIERFNAASENEVIFDDGSKFERARQLANESDNVVVVVGYSYRNEGEYLATRKSMERSARAGELVGRSGFGGDRTSLRLSKPDEELIDSLVGANENLVVVYVGGSAIDMSGWQDRVPAILYAWYAGMEGGNALARVLYGAVNPSGKLPFAIPRNSKDYPEFTPYAMNVTYDYYHGYTLFDKLQIEVAYPFGWGLSYTKFQIEGLSVVTPEIESDGRLNIQVTLINVGTVAGAEVVQLYVGYSDSAVDRPEKVLRDFKKQVLGPGEKKLIELSVLAEDLAWYNEETHSWEVETSAYNVYVGNSSSSADLLKSEFRIV